MTKRPDEFAVDDASVDDAVVDEAVRAVVAARVGTRSYSGSWADIARPRVARRTRMMRFAVPAAAAVVVLAIVGAIVWAGAGPGRGPGVGSAPTTPAKRHDPQPASAEAVQALDQLAAIAAGTAPAPLRPGQFIYVHNVGFAGEYGDTTVNPPLDGTKDLTGRLPQDHQTWLDPQGMIPLKTVLRTGDPLTTQPGLPDFAARITAARAELASQGPSYTHPTPEWLASLPADDLIGDLRKRTDPASAWPGDEQVFTSLMFDFFPSVDPVLPAATRVAVLQAMKNLTDLTTRTVTIDGRALVAIRHTEEIPDQIGTYQAKELLFDPATAHAVGHQELDVPSGAPTYRIMWQFSIVDSLDQTGP